MRILIADSQPIVRRGLRSIIGAAGWETCGEAGDGQEALDLAIKERPDVVLLEFRLPTLSGDVLSSRILANAPETRIVFFTSQNDDETLAAAISGGARGYVLKSDPVAHIEEALSAIQARRSFFSPSMAQLLLEASFDSDGDRRTRAARLTRREIQVVQLIVEGQSNKQIAHNLDVSIKTIETHRSTAMRKAGVRSAVEFVRFAIKHNLTAA